MEFRDLVKKLTSLESAPKLSRRQSPALEAAPQPPKGYVQPTFKVNAWPEGACALLVEAPGAVGKTSAAEALADSLHWPLVRAEKSQVGSYSLSGIVLDSIVESGPFIDKMRSGDAGIVVDSLDEAHFKAGSPNFLEFVENFKSLSESADSNSVRAPSIVMMSRGDTAELIRASSADTEHPLADVELDFFDQRGAEQFLANYLSQRYTETTRYEYNVHRANPAPFAKLRDSRFARLAGLLLAQNQPDIRGRWDEVAEFLGYAPVLVALAESLAVNNPSRGDIVATSAGTGQALLEEIIESILLREHNKMGSQMVSKLEASTPVDTEFALSPADIYTPREQVLRIASYITGNVLLTPPPIELPVRIRDLYEAAATQFISEHPFVRGKGFSSIVFADFIWADLLLNPSLGAEFRDPVARDDTAGPFFTRFVAQRLSPSASNSVPEDLVETLIGSWNQEGELDASLDYSVLATFASEDASIIFRASGRDVFELEISDFSGAPHLYSNLKNAAIIAEDGIILGRRSEPLRLGPNVILVATEVVIEAESLNVDRQGAGGADVAIGAMSVSANYLTNTDAMDESLRLYCRDVPPKLRKFVSELRTGESFVPYRDYVDFRAIMTSFRPSVRGGPAVSAEKLTQAVVKNNANRKLILSKLLSTGAVRDEGDLYRIDTDALAALSISLSDVKGGEPSKSALDFLISCRQV